MRWKQSDRIFFGFGACHILAGVFLSTQKANGWYGEWIKPNIGFSGNHIYATNGLFAFDFHGYSLRRQLTEKYWKGQKKLQFDWDATIEKVDFPLLDTAELNKRNHLGPDQYYGDPIRRAKRFIATKKFSKNSIGPSSHFKR